MTQEEMLLEAAQTGLGSFLYSIKLLSVPICALFTMICNLSLTKLAEVMNLRNLERVLAREEEVKKKAIVHKAVYNGPQIQYISKNGKFLTIIWDP